MANANVTLINTSNTFQDWMIRDNNLANSINELRNGNYYKDSGGFTIANGSLVISGTSGTLLSVSGNATISQQITSNTILNTGDLTVQGNNILFTSTTGLMQIANAAQAKNLTSNTVLTAQYITIPGSSLNANISPNVAAFNELAVINVNSAVYVTNTGNVQIHGSVNLNNPNATVNIAGTLNVSTVALTNNLSIGGTLTAPSIKLISNGIYYILNGDAVFNNVTVSGTQTIVGNVVNATDTLYLRYQIPTDGDGHIIISRGSSAGNSDLRLNSSANVLQFAANNGQTYNTLLTTANLSDSISSNSTINAATANAVEWAYNTAIASANLVAVYANDTLSMANANINFNNTASVNVSVTANATNKRANVAFTVNTAVFVQTTGSTMSGDLNMANNRVTQPVLKAQKETYYNVGTLTTNTNIDLGQGTFLDITLANNANLTFQNCGNSGNVTSFTLMVRQTANGSNTLSYANTIKWSDNQVPVLSIGANTADVLHFFTYNGGTIWWGAQVHANIAGANTY